MPGIKNGYFALIFILTIYFPTIQAQDISDARIQHYGVEEGLSHRNATGILQDDIGFLWISTYYGLNRFDGLEFKWYTKEKDGLQSNQIDLLYKDAQKNLWLVFTGNPNKSDVKSIDIFNPTTEKVASFQATFGEKAPFAAEEIQSFSQNREGHFAFFTAGKFHIYTDHFESFSLPEKYSTDFFQILLDEQDEFWLMHYSSLKEQADILHFDSEGNFLKDYTFEPTTITYLYTQDNIKGLGVSLYHIDEKFKVYSQDFFKINSDGDVEEDKELLSYFQMTNFLLGYNAITFHDNKGYFWVLSDDEKLIRIKKDGSEPPTFLTDFQPELTEANQIFSDNKGNIWIPTQFGLYQLAPQKQNFKRLHFNASPKESHKNQSFRSIQSVDRDGEKILWAAGEKQGQIIKIDLETEKSTIISENFDFQWTVGKNQKNEIFFFEKKGIQKINGLTGEYLKFYPFDETDDVWLVSFFHEDRYGKNWYNNLLDGSLRYFTENGTKIFPLWAGIGDNFYIYQMEETTNDTAWLGTNVGLFKMSIKDGKIYERYWSGENASLPFDNVHHFHITGEREFWLATAGNGLIKWSPEKGVISQVTRSDGLSNNTLYAVYPDKRGNLWLTSDFGINVYNIETGRIKIYTTKDGISHNEFNRISHHEDKDGNLYFGSLNGITAFHPASFSIDSSQHHPPVVLTEFSQYDKYAEKFVDRASEVRKTNTISIYPDDPMVNLKFSLLSYEDMNNVLYAIKTEGVDEDWIYQKSNRYTLGRMPYGKHKLRIKGLASNGQWSKEELQIEINTIAPYYLQPWFPISILLTISAAFFFYYKRREKILKERSAKLEAIVLERTATIERQKEDLKSLDAMKSRLFANVSHELRTPITLIKGPIKTVLGSNKLDEKDFQLLTMAERNANSLLKLVNSILELSKMEHGNLVLNEKPEHIQPLIKRQVANFESLAHQKNIDLKLTLGTEPNLVIQIDREKFEIVLNNLLSNALKFTSKNGQIELKVKQKLKTLLISVQDNGRGISENDLPFVFDRFYQSNEQDAPLEGGTGIGLAYCKELVNLMDGQIWVESKKGFGSTFSIEIPLKKVNL